MSKLQYLSVEQAAVVIGVTSSLVRRWCREGRLPVVPIGKLQVLPAVAVHSFARKPRKKGRKPA